VEGYPAWEGQRRVSYSLVNGLRVHYLAWEPEEYSQPAILLHGLASNARIWEKVAPYLAEGGMRVLAPDLRGHGHTDKPENGYDFANLTQDLAALVDGWGAHNPLLVGHSWGASLALAYAARFPLGPLAPRGLVMVDGGLARLADGAGETWEDMRERLKPPRLAGMRVEDFLDRVRKGQTGWLPDEQDLSIILANFSVSAEETITPQLSLDNHLAILQAMWEMETWEKIGQIRCPLLAVLAQPSEADESGWYQRKQRGAETALKIKPELEIIWMENTIHDIPLQRPAELSGLLLNFFNEIH
jgi:pimeloyl-ACP methyl ester carboxylesterase